MMKELENNKASRTLSVLKKNQFNTYLFDQFLGYLFDQKRKELCYSASMHKKDLFDYYMEHESKALYVGTDIKSDLFLIRPIINKMMKLNVSSDQEDDKKPIQLFAFDFLRDASSKKMHSLNIDFIIEKEYGLTLPLDRDPKIIHCINKIKEKILNFFIEDLSLDHDFDIKQLGEIMLKFFFVAAQNRRNSDTSLLYCTPSMCKPVLGSIINFLSEYKILIGDYDFNSKETAHYVKIANEALDQYCLSLVKEYLMREVVAFMPKLENDWTFLAPYSMETINSEEDISNPFKIKKIIKETDASYYYQGGLFAIVLAITKDCMKERYLYGFIGKDNVNESIRSKNEMARIHIDKCSELEEENKRLSQLLEKEKKINQEHVQKLHKYNFDKQIKQYQHQIGKKDKEINRLKNQIEELKKQSSQSTNKNDDCLNECEKRECIPDYNKKYLFVCMHETLARKILERFPNSTTTKSYTITESNAKTIDAVVVITTEVSHPEYYRIKQSCIKYNVPFINSNAINLDRIAKDIALAGFAKTMQ